MKEIAEFIACLLSPFGVAYIYEKTAPHPKLERMGECLVTISIAVGIVLTILFIPFSILFL